MCFGGGHTASPEVVSGATALFYGLERIVLIVGDV